MQEEYPGSEEIRGYSNIYRQATLPEMYTYTRDAGVGYLDDWMDSLESRYQCSSYGHETRNAHLSNIVTALAREIWDMSTRMDGNTGYLDTKTRYQSDAGHSEQIRRPTQRRMA